MIPCQRHLFDIPDDVAYINCAYLSPMMHSVAEAGRAGIASKMRPWGVVTEDFFSGPDEMRTLTASLLNAAPADIAIIPSVSYGVAIAALNLNPKPNGEVLILKDDFPSDVYSWRRFASEKNLRIRTVDQPTADAPDLTAAVLAAIGPQTRVVSVPQVHWTNGLKLDLVRIGQAARANGAALVLDLTQSLGAMPVDIQAIDPDFAVAACYKWLLGPYGIGVLYVAPRHQHGRPLEEGWIARQGSENFAGLINYQDEYQPGAIRFDMGERSQFQLLPMAAAAMRQVLAWGVDNIAASLSVLTTRIAEEASAMGLSVAPAENRAPHYLGLAFADGPPPDLLQNLRARNVHLSVRSSAVRVTPHLYNNESDIERFFDALRASL
jgi:selenocysteine lyase/cysteine desulfurase